MQFVNKSLLCPRDGVCILTPPDNERGFRQYPETPTFRFDKKSGRAPRDMELMHDYWLVSDKFKNVLEEVDPNGVAFLKCETVLANGEDGPRHWLLDVVRVLDALDFERSTSPYPSLPGYHGYFLDSPNISAYFREEIVGAAHIFRLQGSRGIAICDDVVREACTAANIKGTDFRNTVNRPKR